VKATFSSPLHYKDVLVIEIPTVSRERYRLFDNDGGWGLKNDDPLPFDIIDFIPSTYVNPTCTCKILLGDAELDSPLRYACTNW
jgi:hypothetical protein